MEHPAVDDHIELRAELVEVEHVADPEPRADAALLRLGLGTLDRQGCDVDAGGFGALPGGEEGVLTGSAAGVQDVAMQFPRLSERQDCRLRLADIPRG